MPVPYVYKTRINGRSYTVTVNGSESVYDPPLPESDSERFRARFADMVQSGKSPGLSTETSFWSNRGTLADQWKNDPSYLEQIANNVKKRGGTVTDNSVYFQSLVRPGFSDGDPEAMVSPNEGVAKIKRVMEKRGVASSEGHVRVKPRKDVETDPLKNAKPLAMDIVERISKEYRAQGGGYEKMTKQEMTEFVREKHTPKHVT